MDIAILFCYPNGTAIIRFTVLFYALVHFNRYDLTGMRKNINISRLSIYRIQFCPILRNIASKILKRYQDNHNFDVTKIIVITIVPL